MTLTNDFKDDDLWHDEHDDDESDQIENALNECGSLGDGGCELLGTEHCSFVCPYRSIVFPRTPEDDQPAQGT